MHQTMNEYQQDLLELREEFQRVDVKDPTSIQKWFAKHPYLTTNDHAQVANKSLCWIRGLKRRANIKGRMPKTIPKPKPHRSVDIVDAPEDWDNKEWLEEAIKKHSISAISRAVGLSRKQVLHRIYKYGLKNAKRAKQGGSKNPFCTYEWCYEHYVNRGWTQTECAEKAGIQKQTFAIWLTKFKIPTRNLVEAGANFRYVSLWVREAVHKLNSNEAVTKARQSYKNKIRVRYKDTCYENYFIDYPENKMLPPNSFRITKNKAIIDKIPPVILEYESEMDGNIYPGHIIIKHDEWKQSTFLEKRIALHYMNMVLTKRGWVWPRFPEKIVEEDWKRIKYSDPMRFVKNGVFIAQPNYGRNSSRGLKFIMHFFEMSTFWHSIFRFPRRTMRLLNQLAQRHDKINTFNVFRMIGTYHTNRGLSGLKILNPFVYRMLFDKLGVCGTVLDLYPNNGYRAIACALLGIKYTTIPTKRFKKAIDHGFAEYINLKYEPYHGQKVDYIINDNDMRYSKIERAFKYMDNTKRMIHFVSDENKLKMVSEYKPERLIKVKSSIFKPKPDYWCIF